MVGYKFLKQKPLLLAEAFNGFDQGPVCLLKIRFNG